MAYVFGKPRLESGRGGTILGRVSEKMRGDLETWRLGDLGIWGFGESIVSLSPYLPQSISLTLLGLL